MVGDHVQPVVPAVNHEIAVQLRRLNHPTVATVETQCTEVAATIVDIAKGFEAMIRAHTSQRQAELISIHLERLIDSRADELRDQRR